MLTDGKLKLTRVSEGRRARRENKNWKPLFNAKLMCAMEECFKYETFNVTNIEWWCWIYFVKYLTANYAIIAMMKIVLIEDIYEIE